MAGTVITQDPQAQVNTFRWVLGITGAPATATIFDLDTDPTGVQNVSFTQPMFVMSPVTPHGLPTTGCLFQLQASARSTSATAGVGGFTVTPWMFDPFSYHWASGDDFSADYGELFTTFDFDAGGLYFTVANVAVAGVILIGICEQ